MAAVPKLLKTEQGATFDYEFTWTRAELVNGKWVPGDPIPCGHMTARLQVRAAVEAEETLLDASTENGMIILGTGTDPTDPTTGKVRFLWSGEQTMAITETYGVYDLELYDDTETPRRTYRLLKGEIENDLNVTRES